MNKVIKFAVFSMAGVLAGCATPSAAKRSLLETETTAAPISRAAPVASAGSLTPTAAPLTGEYRGLLSGRRASRVGDTLTVVLDELTRASKDGKMNTTKRASNQLSTGLTAVEQRLPTNITTTTRTAGNSQSFSAGADVRSDNTFSGSGNSSASNQFVGTITVTVVEVLTNGNLRVAGEKRLAVGSEEEIIRFGGVVSPTNIVRNTVMSSRVADARIEYRGDGDTELAKRPGWLSRFLLSASPN